MKIRRMTPSAYDGLMALSSEIIFICQTSISDKSGPGIGSPAFEGPHCRHEKGDPKVAFCHCAYCLLNPGGTPCTSVSSHGPSGLMERLQPLLQR